MPSSFQSKVKSALSAAFLLLLLSSTWAQVRIAVVTTENSIAPAADLLTASLTGITNLALLERSEIERIFREQSLPGAKPDFTRLGRTLRADGLVLMQTITSSAGTNLAMRLVAVNSGAVLDGVLYPWPLPDAIEWQKLAANRLLPLMSKLSVPRERAVPISLLNLRSAVNTPTSVITEHSLSALLFHRLMVEPEVFILERRQMGKLVWEKDLAGPDPQPFWNGAFLLEGVIDRDGADPDILTIHARLSPPNQGPTIEVQASGPRQKPAEVVEALASRILGALQRRPTSTTWNPDAEAQRYEEEASWALRWKVWPEAYVAADSAFALGRHTDGVVLTKMRALMEQAHTPNTLVYRPEYRSWVISEGEAGWVFDPIRNCGWNEKAPLPEVAPNALEALELFHAYCLSTDTNRCRTNTAWLQLGVDALKTAAEVLRHHYFFGWRQNHFDGTLPELRAAARDVCDLLSGCPLLNSPNPPPAHRSEPDPTGRWIDVMGILGPLWQESPEHSINLYRKLMESGAYARNRLDILTGNYSDHEPYGQVQARSWKEPFWVGWSLNDREHGEKLWNEFISKLLASTNRVSQADGALLKLHDAVFDPDIAMATEQFYDAVMDENRLRFRPDVDSSLNDAFDALLNSKGQKTLRRQRLLKAWNQHSFARLKNYLQTSKVHDYLRFNSQITGQSFAPAQAAELLPAFQDYTKRFPGGIWLDTAGQHLRECATRTPDKVIESIASAPNGASNAQPNVAVPVLKVARFWKAVSRDSDSSRLLPSTYETLVEREGRLFALIPQRDHPTLKDVCSFVELDPLTGEQREIVRDIFHGRVWRLGFEVLGDHIYWVDSENTIGQVQCSSAGKVRYFKLDLPLDRAALVASAGRLFITSPEAIAEFFPRDGSLKLLASSRRRPPANKLDAWTWTAAPALDILADGSLLAAFSQTYNQSLGPRQLWTENLRGEWDKLPTLGGQSQSSQRFAPGRFLFYHPDIGDCLDQVLSADGRTETLLSRNPALLSRWSMPFDYPSMPGLISAYSSAHFFDGTNLWILCPPSKLLVTQTRNGPAVSTSCQARPLEDRQATLLCFTPQWEMPRVIPLRLELNSQPVFQTDWGLLPTKARFTQRGLLLPLENIGMRGPVGYWFLPWTDLQSWVASHCLDERNLPRRKAELRRSVAPNENGALELDTRRASPDSLDTNNKFNARRLLLTFDENGDDKLDLAEITNLVQFSNLGMPATGSAFGPIPLPLFRYRADPASLLREFDHDHNGTLELDEVASLYTALASPP